MINYIFRMVMALDATFWMFVIYDIRESFSIQGIPWWLYCIILIGLLILLLVVSVRVLNRNYEHDEIPECCECILVDNDYLPVYLGYFFVSLSIPDFGTLCAVYILVFVFTFITGAQYFNPAFLILGYHFYDVTTKKGTRLFVIRRGEVIRNVKDICYRDSVRLCDTTYIVTERKRKNDSVDGENTHAGKTE